MCLVFSLIDLYGSSNKGTITGSHSQVWTSDLNKVIIVILYLVVKVLTIQPDRYVQFYIFF